MIPRMVNHLPRTHFSFPNAKFSAPLRWGLNGPQEMVFIIMQVFVNFSEMDRKGTIFVWFSLHFSQKIAGARRRSGSSCAPSEVVPSHAAISWHSRWAPAVGDRWDQLFVSPAYPTEGCDSATDSLSVTKVTTYITCIFPKLSRIFFWTAKSGSATKLSM